MLFQDPARHDAMTRLFVPVALAPAPCLALPDSVAHKLRDVLRAQRGDRVTLFDGSGCEFPATLLACSRRTVEVAIGEGVAVDRESRLRITLAQGIARGERMDYALQKAAELGVSRIVPLATERSQVRLDSARAARRRDHWLAVLTHACEQCGRNRLPELADVSSLAAFVTGDHAAIRLTLSPHATAHLDALGYSAAHQSREPGPHPASRDGPASWSIVIGPEGGLAPPEVAELAAAGYRAVRLGPRVLRTETAALVALSVLQALYGDLCG
jgi:16S rRNA (uracil1498-N3)-methyltransferase